MNTPTFVKLLQEMKAALEKKIMSRSHIHQTNDRIHIRNRPSGYMFFIAQSDGSQAKYVSESDTQTLKRPAQNTYEKRLVATAGKEIEILGRCIGTLERCPDINEILS